MIWGADGCDGMQAQALGPPTTGRLALKRERLSN
jgi:hypothetical protein